SASYDPDGDPLRYKWYQYPEAGTYKGKVPVNNDRTSSSEVVIPQDAKGTTIHIIFEVADENPVVALKAYRRIILNVK
ncbi:MAG: hypothetical protein ACPKOP_01490, partial [Sphaerochaetaceae bacterium]